MEGNNTKTIFLEVGNTHNITFENSKCKVSLVKDQALLKKREHEELKEEYSTMVLCSFSHELRTPLNGVIAVTEALYEELNNIVLNTPSNSTFGCTIKHVEMSQMAFRSSKLLFYLVSGILTLAQNDAEQFELNYKRVNIIDIVKYCLDLVIGQAKMRGLNVIQDYRMKENEKFLLDEMKIKIILISMLLNAVKYTFTGEIGVKITMIQGFILISVHDTGIGIDEYLLNTLFTMFSKIENKPFGSSTPIHGTILYIYIYIHKYIYKTIYRNRIWFDSI